MAREDGGTTDPEHDDNQGSIGTLEDYPLDEFDVDVVPGQRRGAHRVATPPLFAAVPWILGGLFVVALIVVLITFSGTWRDSGQAATTPTAKPKPAATKSAPAKAAPVVDKGVRLLVLNGTTRYRLDRDAKGRLVDAGWIVMDTGRNDSRDVQTTFVVYKDPTLKPTAEALVQFLGGGTVQPDPNLPEDMRVVLGSNYED